jgi:hypothetical protein
MVFPTHVADLFTDAITGQRPDFMRAFATIAQVSGMTAVKGPSGLTRRGRLHR